VHLHITERNHADRLPNAKTDSRSNATVQTLDTVLAVDVIERLSNCQVLGAIGVYRLGLHLDTDNLDGLVPCGKTTTKRGGGDFLPNTELLAALLAHHFADTRLGDTRETEARAPVGDLAHGDGVDTAVDTADALRAIDCHESLHGAGGLHAAGCHLVLCDLHRLHARAEAHGGICLRKTANHAARDTRHEVVRAGGLGVVFGFRSDEEEDGALGGGFDPGPWDETLVDCSLRVSYHDPNAGLTTSGKLNAAAQTSAAESAR
jgi:hypothetical protein